MIINNQDGKASKPGPMKNTIRKTKGSTIEKYSLLELLSLPGRRGQSLSLARCTVCARRIIPRWIPHDSPYYRLSPFRSFIFKILKKSHLMNIPKTPQTFAGFLVDVYHCRADAGFKTGADFAIEFADKEYVLKLGADAD